MNDPISFWADGLIDDQALARYLEDHRHRLPDFVRQMDLLRGLHEHCLGLSAAKPHRLSAHASARLHAPRRRSPRRRSSAPRRMTGAIAASFVVLALGALALSLPGPTSDPAPESHHPDRPTAATDHAPQAVTAMRTIAPARWSSIQIAEGSRFQPPDDARHQRWRLDAGALDCTVTNMPESASFTVVTPTGQASVHGTVFRIAHRNDQTTLAVDQGLVQFEHRQSGTVLVASRGRLTATAQDWSIPGGTPVWGFDGTPPSDLSEWRAGQWQSEPAPAILAESYDQGGLKTWRIGTPVDPELALVPWHGGHRLRLRLHLSRPTHVELIVQCRPLRERSAIRVNRLRRLAIGRTGWIDIDLPLGPDLIIDAEPMPKDWWVLGLLVVSYGDNPDLRLSRLQILAP